jgi:DNA (cytosine-5)-methyltransferase 1
MQPKWIVWENVPGVLSSGKGRDFGTFLGALGELGYGFAYRVLDAQWFGVAQRRRRVFVVGHLGDWRRAGAVLFERESVFGNPPTRGAAREKSSYGFADSTGGGIAKPLGAHALSKGKGTDLDNTTYIARSAVSYDLYQITAPVNRQNRKDGNPCHTLARDNAAHAAVVAFTRNTDNGINQPPALLCPRVVRRLTPRECERLQGFPDDYTLVEYRKKPAADGPRYRALGNSMAVPVMRWIGERIAMVDKIKCP